MQKQIVREINYGSWRSKDDYQNIVNQTNIYKLSSLRLLRWIEASLATGDGDPAFQ